MLRVMCTIGRVAIRVIARAPERVGSEPMSVKGQGFELTGEGDDTRNC